ncbi:hypothetical protein BKA69DRAFT_1055158, partial [Paraphysoderma sedebokerense]
MNPLSNSGCIPCSSWESLSEKLVLKVTVQKILGQFGCTCGRVVVLSRHLACNS